VGFLSLAVAMVALHTLANVVWIGSLLAVALIGARAATSAHPAEIGAVARRVYVKLTVPAFVASFAAGLGRILLDPRAYAAMPWFHAKLTFAVGVIVLHHIIGGRARRLAQGTAAAGRGLGVFAGATLACAAMAVLLGIAKSLP
jgi:protoporphyrinogen IX oxidase